MASTCLIAVALDGPVDLDLARQRLAWPEVRRYPYGLALQPPEGGLVTLYGFGAVVWTGVRAVDPALQASLEAATGRRSLPETADSWTIEVDARPRGPRVRVGWDRVVLPTLGPELVAATTLLLAQSATLERYERRADELVEEARALAGALDRRGRPPFRSPPLVRLVGRASQDRLAVASELYILDRPEETWEDPEVAALHDELLAGLELPQRHDSLLQKLDAVEGTTRLVIELWQGRAAHLLEWAIVLLIVFEVVFMLVDYARS